MDGTLLLYGSYGFTGSLVASEAVDCGHELILAGRRAEPLEDQAAALDLDHRVFSLGHPSVVESQLRDVDAVLNCAGPFTATADPLVDACLATGTDYLDVTGRIDVLEAIAERDREAERGAVTLLPAVGFDDVPTDCLAATLAAAVDESDRLTLAMDGLGTVSPGTAKSIVDGLDRPGAVRENGALRSVPMAHRRRTFDFGPGVGEQTGVTVPWGTIATAYYSTGVGNIETYAAVPPAAIRAMELARPLVPLLGSGPVQRLLTGAVDRFVSGPTADERARNSVRLWGEATSGGGRRDGDGGGERVIARMTTPDMYDLTAATAVESARRVLAGEVDPGFQTPVTAFGADYAAQFDGVSVEQVDVQSVAADAITAP